MSQNSTGKARIESLQALRAWAFLGIFFSHAGFFISWSGLGVSVFFVMSGFLMAYHYDAVQLPTSPESRLSFAWKKIKKLYPLHIITMVFAVALYIAVTLQVGVTPKKIIGLVGKIALHVTLTQTWVPYNPINVSLNGVAWYLSVTLFLYFMFPRIKQVVERHAPSGRLALPGLCALCGLILAVEIAACIPFIVFFGVHSPVYTWFMYCFPVFRLGDFFIGCVMKRVFFECHVKDMGTAKATILELLATAITVLVYLWLSKPGGNIASAALHNATTAYIPLAALWVMLFAANRGLLTRLLSNPVTRFIGNISAHAFLIHFVITEYASHCLSFRGIRVDGWGRVLLVSAELLLSIGLSLLYKRLHGKCVAKKA